MVREKSSWIQAAFLVGWALGGGFFGRIGDRLGRSRALSLTILTYAVFTGLSFFAQTWWHLLIFRFLAALGIGGEWAVGASLLSETWPRQVAALDRGRAPDRRERRHPARLPGRLSCWRPSRPAASSSSGILPALLVFWIRRNVPEPAEWHAARASVEAARARRAATSSAATSSAITVMTIAGLRAAR